MKKHLILPAVILIMSSMMLSVSAQENKYDKKVKFEFGAGVSISGPQQQIGNLMKEYGYDDISENWIVPFNGKISYSEHPEYSKTGSNSHFSVCYRIARRSQLGMLLNSSAFGEIIGYSKSKGFLVVDFKNFSIVPLYTYEPIKVIEILVGPAFMINTGANTTSGAIYARENNTDYSIGLLTGLNIKFWDGKRSYGKTGINYLLTADSCMGPYTTVSCGNSFTFPESKINFSNLNLFFAIGLNL